MNHASLFSGIGGPEVAAAFLGWRNVFHCEINPFGRKVLEYWFPESVSYDDITKTDFRKWRGHIDVLTGGFPCQPFSYAGKRGGYKDDRYLWPEMFRAVSEIRPTWVVGENVAGITTMVEGGILTDLGCEATLFDEGDGIHRYRLQESFTIERICKDFEAIGYEVQPILIPAAAVGAPHRRDRVYFIAYNAQDTNGLRWKEQPASFSGKDEQHRNTVTRDSKRLRAEKRSDASDTGDARSQSQCGRSAEIHPSGSPANTDSNRGGQIHEYIQSGCYGSQEWYDEGRPVEYASHDAWFEGTWWNHFPTVSPVHTRDDGLSKIMDRTSLGFHKWRNESIKAYGNAIVPQVMFRIFQAIESVQNENNNY